ncbi:MAG TPA: type II secretion system F family protein [Burkholderiaceae bacterium]|nr:type II secretion system F family protein [Burkholderiaceae bacterium]
MHYRVRVLNQQHQLQTITLEALDLSDAQEQVRAQYGNAVSITPTAKHWTFNRSASTDFPLLLFAQELLALLEAGLSVIETLDALIEKEPNVNTRAVLSRLAVRLREGLRLSDAMREQDRVFPALFVGIVQAAEGTSDLPRALARYIDYQTRLDALRARVVSASVYPSILVIVGGLVTLFLLGYVVPKFATVYQGSARQLPWASELLLSWGGFAGRYAAQLMTGFIAFVMLVGWRVRRGYRRGELQRWLSALPGAASHVRVLELSRFYLTLGMLLEGGIPIQHALGLVRSVMNETRRAALDRVIAAVGEGKSFSESIAAHELATPVALRLLRAGERSAQLGGMLTRAALFHEGETARWIERFTRAFEPALMAGIGLVIGVIVVLLYMPIFELAGSLQ